MIVLVNKSRTGRAYNLPHDSYCTADRCSCSKAVFPKIVEGEGIRPTERRMCASVFVPARGESNPVADQARGCPEVKADLDRGVLAVVELKPAEAAPVAPPIAAAPQKPKARAKE